MHHSLKIFFNILLNLGPNTCLLYNYFPHIFSIYP